MTKELPDTPINGIKSWPMVSISMSPGSNQGNPPNKINLVNSIPIKTPAQSSTLAK